MGSHQNESEVDMAAPNKVNTVTIQKVCKKFWMQLDFESETLNTPMPDQVECTFGDSYLWQDGESGDNQRNDIILIDMENSSIHKKQTVWTSIALKNSIIDKKASNYKALLRGFKRFLVTDFKNFAKQNSHIDKEDMWGLIDGYILDRIGKSLDSEDAHMWLTLIVSPKKALQQCKAHIDQSCFERNSHVALNDLIFKFTLDKAEVVFKSEGNKNLLNLYSKMEEKETAEFSNEISILLSL